METLQDENHWQELAEHLDAKSNEICEMNGCHDDEHNCESYAYIAQDGTLHDVCASDYWRGWGQGDVDRHGEIAAVPLPWHGSGMDLRAYVDEDSFCG